MGVFGTKSSFAKSLHQHSLGIMDSGGRAPPLTATELSAPYSKD